jgi:hypothetical protein
MHEARPVRTRRPPFNHAIGDVSLPVDLGGIDGIKRRRVFLVYPRGACHVPCRNTE